MRRFTPFAILVATLAAIACSSNPGTAPPVPPRFGWVDVVNHYRTPVDVYVRVGGVVVPRRIARVAPGKEMRVRVPGFYMRAADFSLEVCRVARVRSEQNCATTSRYLRMTPVPRLWVSPTERLTAELYGDA